MKKLAILIIPLCFLACKSQQSSNKTSQSNNMSNQIIGTWVYSGYKEGLAKYKKQKAFDPKEAGIEFKEEGKLVVRQNAGWCGTPPISYTNNNGTWKQTSDSTLTIVYEFWGGEAEEDWLVKTSKTDLKIKRLDYRSEEPKIN